MPYILALDVSMGHSYSVLYKDDTCLFEDEIEHTQRGFHALLEEIQHLPERPLIVFEATGIYSRPVEKFFQDHHFSYCLLNPLEAKKQMEESTLRSWKTDKSDAHRLAQTHLKNQRQPKEVQSNFYLEMRDLARFYQEIEKKITRLRMDLHNCLQLTFPELEQFFSNRLTPYALTLIRLFPHPDFVLASTRTKIKNKLINETRKKISANRAEQKADQIIHYAQCAYPAVEKD
ncbi:IS110 family transposase, partial [Enterococcus faecium]